nr:hypothetical protein [Rubrobacter tropicus]
MGRVRDVISGLAEWVRRVDQPSVSPLLTGLQHLIDSFVEIAGWATSASASR